MHTLEEETVPIQSPLICSEEVSPLCLSTSSTMSFGFAGVQHKIVSEHHTVSFWASCVHTVSSPSVMRPTTMSSAHLTMVLGFWRGCSHMCTMHTGCGSAPSPEECAEHQGGGSVGLNPCCLWMVHQKVLNPVTGEGWEVQVTQLFYYNVQKDGIKHLTVDNGKHPEIVTRFS